MTNKFSLVDDAGNKITLGEGYFLILGGGRFHIRTPLGGRVYFSRGKNTRYKHECIQFPNEAAVNNSLEIAACVLGLELEFLGADQRPGFTVLEYPDLQVCRICA